MSKMLSLISLCILLQLSSAELDVSNLINLHFFRPQERILGNDFDGVVDIPYSLVINCQVVNDLDLTINFRDQNNNPITLQTGPQDLYLDTPQSLTLQTQQSGGYIFNITLTLVGQGSGEDETFQVQYHIHSKEAWLTPADEIPSESNPQSHYAWGTGQLDCSLAQSCTDVGVPMSTSQIQKCPKHMQCS